MKDFTSLNMMHMVKILILSPFNSRFADLAENVTLKEVEKASVSLCNGSAKVSVSLHNGLEKVLVSLHNRLLRRLTDTFSSLLRKLTNVFQLPLV